MRLNTFAQWAVATFTAIAILAASRKNTLDRTAELKKEEIVVKTNKIAAEANLQAKEIEKKNLELQSQAEKERIARLALEKQIAPRTITVDQRQSLIGILKAAKNATIKMRATNSTPESTQFAEQIRDMFVAAGWNAPPVFLNMVVGIAIPPGIQIVVNDNKSTLGILIQTAFRSVGIDTPGSIQPNIPPDTVIMVIGQKL